MSIDTAKLRENVAKEHIGLWVDPTGIILALCDELDQARADVLKLRDFIIQDGWLQSEEMAHLMVDTKSYEQYR